MHVGGHAGPGFSPGPLACDASCAPGVCAPPAAPAFLTPHMIEQQRGGGDDQLYTQERRVEMAREKVRKIRHHEPGSPEW